MESVFRLGYVPGATPGKWARIWRERLPQVRLDLVQIDAADAVAALERGDVDAALARLPVDKTRLHAIALYDELAVVVFSRDHLLAATGDDETVTPDDIDDDAVFLPLDDVLYSSVPGVKRADGATVPPGRAVAQEHRPQATADAIAVAASGAGVTVVPMSLARLHHRKDVRYRVLAGGPPSSMGLVWVPERASDLNEEMVGIVRGRTANSTRGTLNNPASAESSGGERGGGAKKQAGSGGHGKGRGKAAKPKSKAVANRTRRRPR